MIKWKRKKVGNLSDADSGWFTDGTPFRLSNVRAHEKHQFGGSKAKRVLAGMLSRSKGFVNVKTVSRGRYGRNIVEMRNKDGSINARMRRKGYRRKGR